MCLSRPIWQLAAKFSLRPPDPWHFQTGNYCAMTSILLNFIFINSTKVAHAMISSLYSAAADGEKFAVEDVAEQEYTHCSREQSDGGSWKKWEFGSERGDRWRQRVSRVLSPFLTMSVVSLNFLTFSVLASFLSLSLSKILSSMVQKKKNLLQGEWPRMQFFYTCIFYLRKWKEIYSVVTLMFKGNILRCRLSKS